jgi:hypothetical protein
MVLPSLSAWQGFIVSLNESQSENTAVQDLMVIALGAKREISDVSTE